MHHSHIIRQATHRPFNRHQQQKLAHSTVACTAYVTLFAALVPFAPCQKSNAPAEPGASMHACCSATCKKRSCQALPKLPVLHQIAASRFAICDDVRKDAQSAIKTPLATDRPESLTALGHSLAARRQPCSAIIASHQLNVPQRRSSNVSRTSKSFPPHLWPLHHQNPANGWTSGTALRQATLSARALPSARPLHASSQHATAGSAVAAARSAANSLLRGCRSGRVSWLRPATALIRETAVLGCQTVQVCESARPLDDGRLRAPDA